FPLKVAAFGEQPVLGYADEPLRPPGQVPQGGGSYPRQIYAPQPTYRPPAQYPAPGPAPNGYPANTPFSVNPAYPADAGRPPNRDYGGAPSPRYPQPSPPASQYPAPTYQTEPHYAPSPQYSTPPPYSPASPGGPVSLTPPGVDPGEADAEGAYQAPPPTYGAPRTIPSRQSPPARAYPGYPSPANADEPPRYRPAPRYPGSNELVPLSPSRTRAPLSVATASPVAPAATPACPILSALDRWIADAVQPAAQKWFGQPVTEIRQISAYSCRGMNGNPNAHISEHAFGNALDIAAFTLADGRKVTVERG